MSLRLLDIGRDDRGWMEKMQSESRIQIKSRGGWGFPGGAVVKNLPANARDTGSSPSLGRSHMPQSN